MRVPLDKVKVTVGASRFLRLEPPEPLLLAAMRDKWVGFLSEQECEATGEGKRKQVKSVVQNTGFNGTV